MNIYDSKTISRRNCGKSIGEIDYDVEVVLPQCGQWANPIPKGGNIVYTVSYFKNNPSLKKSKMVEPLKY